MSLTVQINGKTFDMKDVATMESLILEDREKLRALSSSIEMASSDADLKSGLQKDRLRLRERIRISEALLTLVKG